MRRARDLMIPTPTTLLPTDTIALAREEMSLGNIRHLPIVDKHGALLGMVSDRDLARAPSDDVRLEEIMTEDVVTTAPETALAEVAFLILSRRIGSVLVTDEHTRLVGIVTESDFVRLAYGLLGGADLDERLREEAESDRD